MVNKKWHNINDLYFVRGEEGPEPGPEDIEELQEEQPV